MIFLRASKKSHCWDRTSTAIATSLRRITTGVYQTVRPKKGAVWVRTRCSVEDLKRSTSYRVEAGGSAISWIKCLGSTQTWESASLLHIRRIFQMRYWLDEFICLCFWIDGFFFSTIDLFMNQNIYCDKSDKFYYDCNDWRFSLHMQILKKRKLFNRKK